MSTATLTCACGHEWDSHFREKLGGGCAGYRCRCDAARPEVSFGDRMALLRAEKGDTDLVSHVDDKRIILIGHSVQEAAPDDSDYDVRAGQVVERWHTEDFEPGVTTVAFQTHGREVAVIIRRFMVDQLRQEVLPSPDPYLCSLNAKLLHRVIGQSIRRNGTADRLTDAERKFLNWAIALDNAANPTR